MTSPLGTKIMDNRDAMANGLAELLKPAVQEVDERVRVVRESQVELRQRIEELDDALRELCKEKSAPIDLDLYVKKLGNCKRRIATVNNIVQNAQDRVTRLNTRVNGAAQKRYRFMTSLRNKLSAEAAQVMIEPGSQAQHTTPDVKQQDSGDQVLTKDAAEQSGEMTQGEKQASTEEKDEEEDKD